MEKYRVFLIIGNKSNAMSYVDYEIKDFTIRNDADFNRFDMTKSQRYKHHRKLKLEKKDILRMEKELL